jgi:hypothetical protein
MGFGLVKIRLFICEQDSSKDEKPQRQATPRLV